MRRTLIMILVALLVAGVALTFGISETKRQRENRQEKSENADAYNEQIRDLWQEKRSLERDIQELEQATATAGDNLGSVALLFAEPDPRLETDVFPLMAQHGYTGVIALSADDFAEDAQRLSNERLRELQNEGWELCLSLTASDDLAALCNAVKQTDLDMPKTLYLPETLLTEAQSTIAQAEGIVTVVQHSGTVSGEICYGLPCIMATGSRESLLSEEKKGLSKQLLAETAATSGGLVLTIGYRRVRDTFDENNVSAMLRSIDRYVKLGKLAVSDCVGTQARMATASLSVEDAEKQNQTKLDALRRQLFEVNEKIKSLS